MKKAFLFSALVLSAPVLAQSPTPVVAPTAAASPQPTPAAAVILSAPQADVLRAGTEVPLLLREELTTKKKKLRVGQRFQMEVSANITQNGVTVIPVGTPAIGEVTEVRNKGMWGKSGYIGARIVSLRLGDRHIRLTGTFDDKGVTGTGGVVAAVAFIPVAGFFTTGTSAMIANGAAVKGFLDEDIAFHAVPTQPVAINVPVVQAAPVATDAGAPTAPSAK